MIGADNTWAEFHHHLVLVAFHHVLLSIPSPELHEVWPRCPSIVSGGLHSYV